MRRKRQFTLLWDRVASRDLSWAGVRRVADPAEFVQDRDEEGEIAVAGFADKRVVSDVFGAIGAFHENLPSWSVSGGTWLGPMVR
jgi:hypothetical protein